VNIQLPGPHAQTVASPQPVFYFIPPKQEAAAGVNAGDFILIRLEEKPQRRQFEIDAAGLFRASSGISLTHQLQIVRSEPSPGVYMITTAVELNKKVSMLYTSHGVKVWPFTYTTSECKGAHSAQGVPRDQTTPCRHRRLLQEPLHDVVNRPPAQACALYCARRYRLAFGPAPTAGTERTWCLQSVVA
jgi:hypothetical protein